MFVFGHPRNHTIDRNEKRDISCAREIDALR